MIEGLLSEADMLRLKILCNEAWAPGVAPFTFIEIGSLNGLSASCLISELSEDDRLYCFDLFEPEKLASFKRNLYAEWALNRITPIVGDFRTTLPPLIAGLPDISFAFVDHDHAADTTKAAWDMLWPRMAKGGILAFHDYGHPDYPGGTDYLRTRLADNQHELPTEGSSIIAFTKV